MNNINELSELSEKDKIKIVVYSINIWDYYDKFYNDLISKIVINKKITIGEAESYKNQVKGKILEDLKSCNIQEFTDFIEWMFQEVKEIAYYPADFNLILSRVLGSIFFQGEYDKKFRWNTRLFELIRWFAYSMINDEGFIREWDEMLLRINHLYEWTEYRIMNPEPPITNIEVTTSWEEDFSIYEKIMLFYDKAYSDRLWSDSYWLEKRSEYIWNKIWSSDEVYFIWIENNLRLNFEKEIWLKITESFYSLKTTIDYSLFWKFIQAVIKYTETNYKCEYEKNKLYNYAIVKNVLLAKEIDIQKDSIVGNLLGNIWYTMTQGFCHKFSDAWKELLRKLN